MKKMIFRNCKVFGITILLISLALSSLITTAVEPEEVISERAEVELDKNEESDITPQINVAPFIDFDLTEDTEHFETPNMINNNQLISKNEQGVNKYLVLWYFYKEYCGSCELQSPVINELEHIYSNRIEITCIDVNANPELGEKYDIHLVPTILIDFHSYNMGSISQKIVGYRNLETLVEIIDAKLGTQKTNDDTTEPPDEERYDEYKKYQSIDNKPQISQRSYDSAPTKPNMTHTSDFINISVVEAKKLIDMIMDETESDIVVLDVRTFEECISGYIARSIPIPIHYLEENFSWFDNWFDKQNDTILVYCKTGKRSKVASDLLVQHGFELVYNMLGGIDAWIAAGYELVMPLENISNNVSSAYSFNQSSGSDCNCDSFALDSPTDSGIRVENEAPTGESECSNGCGPDGWKSDIIDFYEFIFLGSPYPLDFYFYDVCLEHDLCYCYGPATYCVDRQYCDIRMYQDMLKRCDKKWKDTAIYPDCIEGAWFAYEMVKYFGSDSFTNYSICIDYYGEWDICPPQIHDTVYVNKETWCKEYGTPKRPVSSISQGANLVYPGGTVIIDAGIYQESLIIAKPMTLKANGGSVIID